MSVAGADIYYIRQVEVRVVAGPLETPCHIWQGHLNQKGYASAGSRGRRFLVHREVYASGYEIPPGHAVHHRCEDKRCVNIEHLQAMPIPDHVRLHTADRKRRDRGQFAASPQLDPAPKVDRRYQLHERCQRGHLLAETGKPHNSGRGRYCSECRNMRRRKVATI